MAHPAYGGFRMERSGDHCRALLGSRNYGCIAASGSEFPETVETLELLWVCHFLFTSVMTVCCMVDPLPSRAMALSSHLGNVIYTFIPFYRKKTYPEHLQTPEFQSALQNLRLCAVADLPCDISWCFLIRYRERHKDED